jgi:hypothetical protein
MRQECDICSAASGGNKKFLFDSYLGGLGEEARASSPSATRSKARSIQWERDQSRAFASRSLRSTSSLGKRKVT